MLGKGTDEGDLDKLGGLNGNANAGNGQPASVGRLGGGTRVAGHQRQAQKGNRPDQHHHPQAVKDDVVVQIGHDKGDQKPCRRHGKLHLQLAHAEVVYGAVHRYKADHRQERGAQK